MSFNAPTTPHISAGHTYVKPQARSWTCEGASCEAAAFQSTLPGFEPTPLVEIPALAVELNVGRVFIKDESKRWALGAFKVLGASWAVFNEVARLTGYTGEKSFAGLHKWVCEQPPVVLVTATDGNHGRAVARLARLLGLTARVFVPEIVPEKPIARIRAEGAEITVVKGSYDDSVCAAIAATGSDPRASLVQDTSWEGYEQVPFWTSEGYSTLFGEVDSQLESAGAASVSLIGVPVGVGSLAHAAVIHYRSQTLTPPPSIMSVEPDTAACVLESLSDGYMHSVPTGFTIMNGLNFPTPSTIAWPYLINGMDAAVAVTDTETASAVEDLKRQGVTSGPSGASSLAGLRTMLLGDGGAERRSALGLTSHSVAVAISTEGFTD
ncbi:diaminopropionate ammonia-lyase [Rhodococcus sp. NPDC059968]|uniref:diaminopropionate ammonia-lyase n=1 Tax=Rhodococcus sp. NPDC059968 TaxID=3347017 RepID=UPI0036728FFC